MKKFAIILLTILLNQLYSVAQSREIFGRITDDTGKLLENVKVQLKGTDISSLSATDGTYRIAVPENAAELIFTFPGMQVTTIAIAQANEINVVLTYEPNDLFDLSLEQLMEIKITTASKKEEKISDIPASVVILTKKEIELYGFANLEEIFAHITGLYYVNNESFGTSFR